MRRLLTPKNLFELPVVEFNGNVIAVALILKGKSIWHYEYAASDIRFLKHGSNQLLIWESIKRAQSAGAQYFDFGRTALWHRSLLVFKDRWRTVRHPIRYRMFPAAATTPRWHDNFRKLSVTSKQGTSVACPPVGRTHHLPAQELEQWLTFSFRRSV